MLRRWLLAGGALALLVVLGALWTSDSWATGMLVMAPSPGFEPVAPPGDVSQVIDVERAGARVRAWVLEPLQAPRGTVLVLHGIRDGKLHQLSAARAHVARGLRAVVVDSRGHGESSGRFLTYGVEESRDLSELLDRLQDRGRFMPPLAVVGSSYGAATALLLAARDARVRTVVASAPFASLREVIPAYLRWIGGPLGGLVPAAWIDARLAYASAQAGFDPAAACPRCVAPRIAASVLLIHSRDDERIPFSHTVAIHAALRSPKRLLPVAGVGHVDTNRAPGVEAAIARWLTERLAPAP